MPLVTATAAQVLRLRRLLAPSERAPNRTSVPQGAPRILFRITNAVAIAGKDYQWLYELDECRRDEEGEYTILENGLAVVAYNLFESGNTSTIVAPGYLLADWPGWEPYPVSYSKTGARLHRAIEAWFAGYEPDPDASESESGATVMRAYWHFDAETPFDGDCPEGSES